MIVSSAAMVSISYISLLTGMLKKSSKTAIVTSVIIACFTQGNIGEATARALVKSLENKERQGSSLTLVDIATIAKRGK